MLNNDVNVKQRGLVLNDGKVVLDNGISVK